MGAKSGAIQASRKRRVRGRRLAVRFGLVAFLGFLVWSGSGPVAADAPGSPTCELRRTADAVEYQVGEACPPSGFAATMGYEPVLVDTPYGWRYEKPSWADGNCSGPLSDRGLFWNFGAACRTHDYGYDLVRFGVGDRVEADALLYRDMVASCRENFPPGIVACKATAKWVLTVLEVGDATGFDVEPVSQA